jgi:hypothetical protein
MVFVHSLSPRGILTIPGGTRITLYNNFVRRLCAADRRAGAQRNLRTTQHTYLENDLEKDTGIHKDRQTQRLASLPKERGQIRN